MKRQHGQSLVFVMALTAAMSGALLLVFNTGQVTTEKERLINAADAAAYSGAIWQARSLNFQAYMNRAIVANEVAIAQSVSLRSWSDYLKQTLQDINLVGRFIPYVGAVTNALEQGSRALDRGAQATLARAEGAISVLNHSLAAAQEAVHAQALIAARAVAADTLHANDPTIDFSRAQLAFSVQNGIEWNGFTKTFDGQERTRLRDVVVRSRDGFTKKRNTHLDPLSAVVGVRFDKRGGTEMLDFDGWRGMDTMSLHVRQGLFFGSFKERTPIGFGSAENTRVRVRRRGDHGGSFRKNPIASRLAERSMDTIEQGSRASSYRGLSANRDLADPQRSGDRTIEFAVEAEKSASELRTADRALGVTDASISQPPSAPNDRLYALSSAQVYFARPEARRDGRREFPSLYNPYWQVRLNAVDGADRTVAAQAKRVVDPYVALAP